ncbi:MAG: hypothetical protein OXD29_00980 [Roseovarius sp.]|nr:hypothetical protein [Roseovarius sp.]MCY4290273.1 hypothetical protein [Roseovarius sp.]MCY4316574.1 hypothetical protein [Roseovarius sp.]
MIFNMFHVVDREHAGKLQPLQLVAAIDAIWPANTASKFFGEVRSPEWRYCPFSTALLGEAMNVALE